MRYFFSEQLSETCLNNANSHYICNVLRLKKGDRILLCNGEGCSRQATIIEPDKRNCLIQFEEEVQKHERTNHASIALSFTKNNNRTEWFLEKASEIGIRHIYPMITARSEHFKLKRERIEKIFVSAMLQSQQFYLPVLHEPVTFNEVLEISSENKFIAHCEKENSRTSPKPYKGNALLLIGPEGDFTRDEIKNARQKDFIEISLGFNRLRTETAGIVGLTLLHYLESQ